MDLVKSYNSEIDDDSDIEEIQITSSMAKASKEVDVIELLDSDSDNEFTVQKSGVCNEGLVSPLINPIQKTTAEVPTASEKKLLPSSSQDIDLGNDNRSVNTSNKESQKEAVSKVTSDSSEKKIDYLNLEDSESDTEVEQAKNDVNTLIDSASVLSDVSAGPQKRNVESLNNSIENSFHGQEIGKGHLSNASDSIYNSPRSTPDISQCAVSGDSAENSVQEPSRKYVRADSVLETNDFQNDLDSFELDNNSLYREDYQVIPETESLLCRIPRQIVHTYTAHTNIVTSLDWCIKKFSYLFLSSSLDGSVKIWDLFRKKLVQYFVSDAGLSVAKWSLDGHQIMTGGKGKKACIYDVQSGKRIVEYDIYNIVTSMEVHPYMEDVFLCGTRNAILGFDMRVNTKLPIRAFFSKCEEVLDIAFVDESQFICSTNIVSKDSADRTIMVWHFGSGAKMSNEIYLERFTCPSIKVHPYDSTFIAQSNGNYIASFSAARPYTVKNKRYIGHKVAGYGIECDISPDGKYVVSGDAEGSVYFYNCSNTNAVFVAPSERKIPTNRVKWHPALCSTVVTSSYDGQIQIWK